MIKKKKTAVEKIKKTEGLKVLPKLGIYPSEKGTFVDIGSLWVSIKDFFCPRCNESRNEIMVFTETSITTIVVMDPSSVETKVYVEKHN